MASRIIIHGSPRDKELAIEWLTGGKPALKDLKASTGIGTRIDDDSLASEVLAQIVTALAASGKRTVLLIDEFQRISHSSQRQREAILSQLRTIFSKNPERFSVILAAASKVEKSALDLLPHELKTLLGMRASMSLPEMSVDEAVSFLQERFRYFRPQDYQGDPDAPFGTVGLKTLVEHVASMDRARLIPRSLLQATARLYDEATLSGWSSCSEEQVKVVLKDLSWA